MQRWIWWLVLAGLTGLGLLWLLSGSAFLDPTAPVSDDDEAASEVAAEGGPGAPTEVRPVPRDPDAAFRAAMAMALEPPNSSGRDAGREIQQQVRHLSESIELAVASQRELADGSPERAAEATERAIQLYEHAAAQLDAAPVPPLPYDGDADRYRKGMARLAEARRRRAQAIREGGL